MTGGRPNASASCQERASQFRKKAAAAGLGTPKPGRIQSLWVMGMRASTLLTVRSRHSFAGSHKSHHLVGPFIGLSGENVHFRYNGIHPAAPPSSCAFAFPARMPRSVPLMDLRVAVLSHFHYSSTTFPAIAADDLDDIQDATSATVGIPTLGLLQYLSSIIFSSRSSFLADDNVPSAGDAE